MTAQPQLRMTPQEYLAFEESSPEKHEYFGGRIVLLAGGNQAHAMLCSNINALLSVALFDRPCLVFTSDMKVKAERPAKYMYPDVSVVCSDSVFEDARRRTLLNPAVITVHSTLNVSTTSYRFIQNSCRQRIANKAAAPGSLLILRPVARRSAQLLH